jgi:hypothetical protein
MLSYKGIWIAVAVSTTFATAQLKQGSLSIKGGETFKVGQVVQVTFTQLVGNNGLYDFYWSKDGGVKWTETVGNWQGPKGDNALVTYPWTVPNAVSTTVQFRACQMAGGHCTDPAYILKSPNFTITATSGVLAPAGHAPAPSIRYDAATRSLEAAFELAKAEPVSLQVIDAGGRVVATLAEGRREAGFLRVSVFSNRLENASGRFLLKLDLGAESFTQPWNGVR